jgi:phosphotransferase system enzyme I (PtsI)
MERGIGTSKGIGMGKVLCIVNPDITIKSPESIDPEVEKKRFIHAKDEFIKDIECKIKDLQTRLGKDDKTSLVLKNQIYLIKDRELRNEVEKLIDYEKVCAESALDQTCSHYIKIFASMENDTMNQRVADIVDMKNRMLYILTGTHETDLTNLPENTIIVAKELHPSMTAAMDINHIVGIIAEKGGDTSHASILARALEIPAVLSVKDACTKIKNDDFVIVDGEYGEVFINPIQKTVEIYEKKKKIYMEAVKELKKYVNKETITADGLKVCLAGNIGNAADARKAMENGAEGVGLFRTEFLFMNNFSLPSEEEQFEAYKMAAVICKDKPLTIRTLDIGGDKDVPYLGLSKESNPFLGYRAIRFCLDRVDIFTAQLRAILRASAYGNIRIMIPLVTSVTEIITVKNMVHRIMQDLEQSNIAFDKNIKLGAMIETPAACIMADVLAKEVDFFSIGTNDLTQYTVAVDRGNENVSYLYSVFNPAVLRSIKRVIDCAKRENIEVGMCGEAAGTPAMIPLLLSFGLDEFSVTPSKILETRKEIASWTKKESDMITDKVMGTYTEKEVSTFLSDYIATRNENTGK